MQGEKKTVSASEEKLYKILGKIGEVRNRRISRSEPQKVLTIGEICKIAEVDTENLSHNVKALLGQRVFQICRAGSRFTKYCLAVQFDEDNAECMVWAGEHGATVLLTREQILDYPCIVVDRPEIYYARLCRYYRDLSSTKVVAVVGSIGKTTTKRMISNVLKEQFYTFNDPENENQIDCVGYSCQHIPNGCQWQVQEVSEDTPGCVELMSEMLRPEIAIITTIDKSHIEAFGCESAIIQEISKIQQNMPEDGVVIVNLDDENICSFPFTRERVTISLINENADFYANSIAITDAGIEFRVAGRLVSEPFTTRLKNVYASHNIYAVLYAVAVGYLQKISNAEIVKAVSKFRTSGYRQNIYKAKNNITVYADCYNAVSKSIASAVEACSEIPILGKRIAVLGDVEETGALKENTHREILDSINSSSFDVLIIYGNGALNNALNGFHFRDTLTVISCGTKQGLTEKVRQTLRKNDLVLFKASRKSALEDVIRKLFPLNYCVKQFQHNLPIVSWRLRIIVS